MTDRKPPTPDDDDELFDRDALDNSDSDFLAELDRVLGDSGADSSAEAGQVEADDMSTRIQEPQWGPETEDLEPDAVDHHDSLELELNVADDLLDLSDAATASPAPTATPTPTPSIERAAEAKEPHEAMELDWDNLAPDNEPTAAAAPSEKPAAPKPMMEENAFVPLSQDKLAEMKEQVAAASLLPDEPKPVPRTESSAAPPPSTPAPVAETGNESSAVWSGLVALLALTGIGIGGVALWQQSQLPGTEPAIASDPADGVQFTALEQRLSKLEAQPNTATTPPVSDIDSQSVSVLEQRMTEELERLGGEIADLRNTLAQTDGNDAGESAALDRLGSQITSLTERLDNMDDRLRGAESAAKKAAAKPARPKSAAKTPGGKGVWTVNLLSFQRIEKAEQEMARLRGDGLEAQIRTVTSKGKTWHRVVVSGFKNVGDAKAYAQDVRKKPGLSSAWIGRN